MGQMRQCSKMEEGISAFVDGEIAGRRRRAVERHLAECPRCRALREDLLGLKSVLERQAEAQQSAPVALWDTIGRRLEQVDARAPIFGIWMRRSLVPAAVGIAAVLLVLAGLGVFRGGAVLSPEALAAEFPKQGGVVSPSEDREDIQAALARVSQLAGFEVSPPDFSNCGFRLVYAVPTEVDGLRGVSFLYRRGCDVVVVSQIAGAPRLEGFTPTVGRGGQRIHEAVVKDLKLVVWQEKGNMSGLSCSRKVFVGPMGCMRCR